MEKQYVINESELRELLLDSMTLMALNINPIWIEASLHNYEARHHGCSIYEVVESMIRTDYKEVN